MTELGVAGRMSSWAGEEPDRFPLSIAEIQSIIRGSGAGTREDPWRFEGAGGEPVLAYRDKASNPPALVIEQSGRTHRYSLDWLDDLGAVLVDRGMRATPPRRRSLTLFARDLVRRTLRRR